MLFRILAIAGAALVTATPTPAPAPGHLDTRVENASAAMNTPAIGAVLLPSQVISAIQVVREQADNLAFDAQGADFGLLGLTALLNPIRIMPLVDGFVVINTTIATDNIAFAASPLAPFVDVEDQTQTCSALHDFLVAYQNLLTIVVAKLGILNLLGFNPLAAVLKSLDSGIDLFTTSIIPAVPTCADGVRTDITNLEAYVKTAICAATPLGGVPIVNALVCQFD